MARKAPVDFNARCGSGRPVADAEYRAQAAAPRKKRRYDFDF